MNVSKTGLSFSAGPKGGALTLGTSGARGTMSLPGTGLFYTVDKKNIFTGSKSRKKTQVKPPQSSPPRHSGDKSLTLGFFDRLVVPKEEQIVVQGFRALVAGQYDEALMCFEKAPNTADAHWIAGMIRLKKSEHTAAEKHLLYALNHEQDLGALVGKYDVEVILQLPITEHVMALAQPRRRGTLLALIESHQDRGALSEAKDYAKTLLEDQLDDPVALLSYVELHFQADSSLDKTLSSGFSRDMAPQVVQLLGELSNNSDIHAALLMYKSLALTALGLHKAALTTLTTAYRKKKDRDEELLKAIRYYRAGVYRCLGQYSRAQSEFEGLYATDPSYEDVAHHLGL